MKTLLYACFLSNNILFSISGNKSISYHEIGAGQPLVLIHAFPTDQRLWQVQKEGLKDKFRVITLDLHGFGQSSSTDGQAITMEEYADQIKNLLAQLNIQQAIIGGESMGGYISLAFLKKYPENVKELILSSTQSIADSMEKKNNRELDAIDMLENGPQNFLSLFMSKAFSSKTTEEIKISLKNIVDSQKATAMASAWRGIAQREDNSSLLENSKLPILIITGDQDELVPMKQSEYMHALAKNSRLIILKDVGHFSNFEQPQAWNQAVIDMFSK